MQPFRHVAVPYDSDEGFVRLILPRVLDGLREDRRVLVITSEHLLDLLSGALEGDARRVELKVSTAWYLHPHRTLAAFHDYTRGHRTLLVGEPLWSGLDGRATREWIRYESVINATLRDADATLLCAYDLRTSPPPVLARLAQTHPVRLAPTGLAVNEPYVPPHEFVIEEDLAPFGEPAGPVESAAFTAQDLKRLRRTVADYARAAGMERGLIAAFVLSVSEIAANSVEHGSGHGTIGLWTDGGELVCEIVDPGGFMDHPLPGHIPPEPGSPRGYGLWISRQLCDLVEMREDGGMLRVRLRLGLTEGLGLT